MNTINVSISPGPEDDKYFVSLEVNGFSFMTVAITKSVVDEWEHTGELAGRMMEIFADSHPAMGIVEDLLTVLPHITSISHPEAVDAFKARTSERLAAMGRLLPT